MLVSVGLEDSLVHEALLSTEACGQHRRAQPHMFGVTLPVARQLAWGRPIGVAWRLRRCTVPRGTASADGTPGSRSDRDLHHAVALVRKQLIGGFDLVELEAVRDQRLQIHVARCDHVEQSAHALLTTGA